MRTDNKKQAAEATIEQCLQEGILVDLLREKGNEIIECMVQTWEQLDENNRYFRAMRSLGERQGKVEGMAEGEKNTKILIAKKLLLLNANTLEQIAQITGFSEHKLQQLKSNSEKRA